MTDLLGADERRGTVKNARKGDGLMAEDDTCRKIGLRKVAAGMALAVQKGRKAAPAALGRRQLWVRRGP